MKITTDLSHYEKLIHDDLYSLIGEHFSEAQAKEHLDFLVIGTQANLNKTASIIKGIIDKLPWSGSNIDIRAMESYDAMFPRSPSIESPASSSTIEVYKGGEDLTPNFTLFTGEEPGTFLADDVLDAGDEEFFNDPDVEMDYFSLIGSLRQYGRDLDERVITLFTARPKKDRKLFEEVTSIPSRIFLTTNLGSAIGIAKDMGDRDVWKIKVSNKWLINTLDSPLEKQYQTIPTETGVVPVRKITMFLESEYIK